MWRKKGFFGRLHERSTEVAFPPLKGWCNFLVGQLERGKWKNSKYVLLLTVESEMKWYFPTNQEKYFFVFWPTFRSILNCFQFLQLLKKTLLAHLRGPHPFRFGKPSAFFFVFLGSATKPNRPRRGPWLVPDWSPNRTQTTNQDPDDVLRGNSKTEIEAAFCRQKSHHQRATRKQPKELQNSWHTFFFKLKNKEIFSYEFFFTVVQ